MHDLDQLKNLTILFAEDDEISRESIYNGLCVFCDNVLVAANGADALKLYNAHLPQIVILDIEMPLLNGLDVAKEIRLIDSTTAIVIVTNHIKTDYLLDAVKLFLIDYVVKPLSFEKIKIFLKECIAKLNANGLLIHKIDTNIHYNFISKEITNNNNVYNLTKYEYYLIELLIHKKGMIVTYDMIDMLFHEPISQDSIKNLIYRLKQKIGKGIIINIKNIGYCIK